MWCQFGTLPALPGGANAAKYENWGKKRKEKRLPCGVQNKNKNKNKTYPAGYEKKRRKYYIIFT